MCHEVETHPNKKRTQPIVFGTGFLSSMFIELWLIGGRSISYEI